LIVKQEGHDDVGLPDSEGTKQKKVGPIIYEIKSEKEQGQGDAGKRGEGVFPKCRDGSGYRINGSVSSKGRKKRL